MNKKFGLGTAVVILIAFSMNAFVFASENNVKKKIENGTMDDKISYAIGYDVGSNLKKAIEINSDLFYQGIKDSLTETPNMTQDQMMEAIQAFQNIARNKKAEAMAAKLAENKAAGQAFLTANKSKEGVIQLDSGLQYKVIKQGDGESPKPADKVKCHYRGTLINGREFDSSYSRNEPTVFPVNGVIKGWTQALQLMKTGSKWMLYVPSDLAYGDRGAGSAIEPGSTLIFEVELLSIEQ